ncbi:glycoside hydrolase family 88/105 protein [Coprobacter secundus]|uniref:glycoside hydrolase family 88/105 protein n=1 Tax=Coprobacter secundus TaxID=1501392 RepID=UPI000ACC1981
MNGAMLFFRSNILRLCLSVIILGGILFPLMGSQPIIFPHLKGKFAPERVGTKLSERYLASEHMLYAKTIHYAEVCTWYGAVRFAEASGKEELLQKLIARFEPLLDNRRDLLPLIGYKENFNNYVDFNMFGCLPLELYRITGRKVFFDIGIPYADSQWSLPDFATEKHREYLRKGFTWQTRLWIDDMYMITVVQAKAYQVTGDVKYIDRAAKEMVYYLEKLQRPNGLFYHAPDVPFYWARGNGWMAAGMAELLCYLPDNHECRAYIMEAYRKMMETLKLYQHEDGMWGQLVDRENIWPETSGSAMFVYAVITGIKQGWLDSEVYMDVAMKGWKSLVSYINDKGDLTEICVGTGKKNSESYYYERPRKAGDFHGQGPMLWCAAALIEK